MGMTNAMLMGPISRLTLGVCSCTPSHRNVQTVPGRMELDEQQRVTTLQAPARAAASKLSALGNSTKGDGPNARGLVTSGSVTLHRMVCSEPPVSFLSVHTACRLLSLYSATCAVALGPSEQLAFTVACSHREPGPERTHQ
jgi:hypothetical protein